MRRTWMRHTTAPPTASPASTGRRWDRHPAWDGSQQPPGQQQWDMLMNAARHHVAAVTTAACGVSTHRVM
jgi:hypothetical protein